MSIPASEAALKDYLINHDDKYRELADEHHKYDARLSELISLSHPSEDEQIEEAILKKKKLFLKDQMEMIAKSYKTSATSH
ncbi:MAG: DUF465 domain-containing protein [Acidobacteriota bacterium]|nr:DUF465 domain-containing protein [Acidobacteriota bacterium]